MNIFVQLVTKTSNVFFSENILFYNIIIYFYIVIILLCCYYFISIDCKYEYFCTTGNKNFKCVFFEKYFIL